MKKLTPDQWAVHYLTLRVEALEEFNRMLLRKKIYGTGPIENSVYLNVNFKGFIE